MKRVLAYGIDILVDDNEYTEIELDNKILDTLNKNGIVALGVEFKDDITDLYKDFINTEIKLERKELYDEVSEVLTNWEMQKMVDDDLYNMLVKIQNKWEEVIAVDTF